MAFQEQRIREWTLEEEIGRGGMGVVYRARHQFMDGRFALKMIRPEFSTDEQLRGRFLREIRSAVKLKHPNIVESYPPFEEGGQLYLPMELLRGHSLGEELKRRPEVWPWPKAVECIQQASRGLGAAHAQGLIHRDVKPGNLFLMREIGALRIKVLDFGLVKALGRDSLQLSSAGFGMGTPEYLAPETLKGMAPSPATDLYALGVMLFQLLTGRPPVQLPPSADSLWAIVAAVMEAQKLGLPRLSSLRPDVPSWLDKINAAMLAMEPEARPTGSELQAQLERALEAQVVAPSTSSSQEAPKEDSELSRFEIPLFEQGKGKNRDLGEDPSNERFFDPSSPRFEEQAQGSAAPTGRSGTLWTSLILAGVTLLGILAFLLIPKLMELGPALEVERGQPELGSLGLDQQSDSGQVIESEQLIEPEQGVEPQLIAPDQLFKPKLIDSLKLKNPQETIYRLPLSADSAFKGGQAPLVTIVEFSDFQCPYCSRASARVDELLEIYGDKIQLRFRHNPLSFHKSARGAAKATLAARVQGKFWEMHDILFANQRELQPEKLLEYAREIELNLVHFEADLKHPDLDKIIDEDIRVAQLFGARGTPNFFINGRKLAGARPIEAFKLIIDEEIKRAKALIREGTPRDQIYAQLTAHGATEAGAPLKPRAKPSLLADETVYKVSLGKRYNAKGPKSALITIVEFSEFQCPYCSKVGPTLKRVKEKYGKKVRLIFKHNPLPFHKHAKLAAQAALAAGAQGKFWQMHDLLFENQRALERSDLNSYARKLGLKMRRFKSHLKSKKFLPQIEADQKLARSVGANGTPTFFINGRKLIGAQPFENFEKLIDVELGKARAMLFGGIARERVYEEIIKNGVQISP